jgi:hypothetical protein
VEIGWNERTREEVISGRRDEGKKQGKGKKNKRKKVE